MRKTFSFSIKIYQSWISPMFGARCKYYPSCSTYASDAVNEYGLKGLAMAAWRLLRCNPWSHGGVDYVLTKGSKTPIKSASTSMNGTN
ncbi:MAG: membrane protein insertion efficiency factor YidD [Crocinitomicaceae bacterium]